VLRRRRQVATGAVVFLVLVVYFVFIGGGGGKKPPTAQSHGSSTTPTTQKVLPFPKHSPLNPDWKGSGKAITLAFGGDVHFAGDVGTRLAADPETALGDTINQLFDGSDLSMVNLETAVTDNAKCPEPASKPYLFDAPATAFTALKSASVSLATQANDHGVDCGDEGLSQDLTLASQAKFPVIGLGQNATKAFAPYRITIDGQRIAIISATQIIAANLVSTWTATGSQPGVASAIDPAQLIAEVQKVRKTADTVIVYMHWGTETDKCANTDQETLATELVKAGADIIVGSNAHVLQGAGYLGDAYIDYGLGNFAFYDDTAPETDSGALLVTVEGRKVLTTSFRPATDLAGLPQPLAGAPEEEAIQGWGELRSCTNLAETPSAAQASEAGETEHFTPPPTTTTTTAATTTTTTSVTGISSGDTTTSTTAAKKKTTTTTAADATTTAPTDNAG
jgi:hypothetical protein